VEKENLMSIRPITVCNQNPSSTTLKCKGSKPSFAGANPIVGLMGFIAAGGFAASFVTQDFLGMATPRTIKACYRNRTKEHKKYNWAYARLVGIREILSGPSAFIIPGLMMAGIKLKDGRANSVPTSYINGFSNNFAKYAENNKDLLNNEKALKKGFYENSVRNMLSASLPKLKGEDFENKVSEYTDKLVEAGNAPKHYLWFSPKTHKGETIRYAKNIRDEIASDFKEMRKQYAVNAEAPVEGFSYNLEKEILSGNKDAKTKMLNGDINHFVSHILDYTEDATHSVAKKLENSGKNAKEFIENFGNKRIGSRFISNILMTTAVILFYSIIPKLYNEKDGKNPALAGLDNKNQTQTGKEVKVNA
jgi:hypothetical protein